MADLICIIMIVTAVMLVLNMTSLMRVRNMRSQILHHDADDRMNDTPLTEEERTIDLIGEDAFRHMSAHIDEILRSNAGRESMTLNLTCGPDTTEAADTLHSLLPGTELSLVTCGEKGVEWIDVYARGQRIGRLALAEAETVKELMRKNHIKKVYVAEQNCFGIEGSHQMSIILYFEPVIRDKRNISEQYAHINITKKGDNATRNICLN